jgi:hypothetical protein
LTNIFEVFVFLEMSIDVEFDFEEGGSQNKGGMGVASLCF